MIYLETGKMSWDERYGMGRYINELARREMYDCVICANSQKMFVPNIEGLNIISLDDSSYKKELSEYISKNMHKGDVIHFPANLICVDVTRFPKDVRIVLTVHDITPIFYYQNKKRNGNYFSNGKRVSTKQFEENLRQYLPRADRIITVSENTKKDIVSYFGIDERKIITIYNGIDSRFKQYSSEQLETVKEKYGLSNIQTIMAVIGGKHKNIARVITAFRLYCKKNRNNKLHLILVGKISKRTMLLTCFRKSKGKIILTGRVSDEELVDYYNISDGFVFVSLYEGFGFPLLEAMACGAYTICSKTSSLGELGEGYAYLVDPTDIVDIADSFKTIRKLSDDEIKKQREYVKKFTWDNSCRQHIKVLMEVSEF